MIKEIALADNRIFRMFQDEYPESPRTWSNLGTMACFHRRYSLGDKDIPFSSDDFNGWDEMEAYIYKELNALIVLPLYLYDHSGITISTSSFSCRWDSGQVGFIYVTKETLQKEYGEITEGVLETATRVLEGEVKTYDQYLTGDVYGFELVKKSTCDQGHEHEEEIDSCWGFYGSNPKENVMVDHLDHRVTKYGAVQNSPFEAVRIPSSKWPIRYRQKYNGIVSFRSGMRNQRPHTVLGHYRKSLFLKTNLA